MSTTRNWAISGLAFVALVAGILLATGAVSSAQEGSATPTPAPTTEATTAPTDDSSGSTDDSDSTDDADDGEDADGDGHNCPDKGTDDGTDDDSTDSGTESRYSGA